MPKLHKKISEKISLKLLIIFVFTAFLITGCTPKSEKTQLKFMSWGSGSEVEIIRPLIARFEEENPDISIEFIHTPGSYFQKLHLLAAGGLMPDIVFVNNLYGTLYAQNNLFLDLNKFIEKDENLSKEDFFPEALNSLTHKNKLYALPRDVSNLVMYYNKDIFDRYNVPYPHENWTMDEFQEICKKFAEIYSNQERKEFWAVSFREEPLFWLPYLWSEGGGLISEDLNEIIIDKPQSIHAIQDYADLRNKHHAAPTKSEAGSMTMAQMFMQGKLAMHLSGRWFVPVYRREIPFKWDTAMFPQGKIGSVVGSDASGWAISSSSRYSEQAWRFISFMASEESIKNYTESGLITPARVDVANSEIFLDKSKPPENGEVFIHAIKNSIPTPVNRNYRKITDMVNEALQPVWSGRVSADEAVNERLIKRLKENLY